MKELNQEQLLSVSGAGFISAGMIFAGIAFDISAVIMSGITGGREEIVFADNRDASRTRYEII
ncbi:hypothetical protein ISO77_08850 [Morganella morganii subsp. morganii]|uniref:hypothetical protein n=1 Tax=Morganella morganii TaxID=582 RepID=UPI001BDA38A5|nr:hypothetical protein [Morganella morganii]MBT0395642.1 hypothetical protein [Morganella morganii subsp. morganii]